MKSQQFNSRPGTSGQEIEPLSLATFDPVFSKEPFLNTPRSLEACHVHGIQPEELVEIPFREFVRAFPGDDEAALRRYERVDAARRRILISVTEEWRAICEAEVAGRVRNNNLHFPPGGAETIIAPDTGPITLLEVYAARFRMVEQQQWKCLQKMLFKEIRNAAYDQKSKLILQKHESLGNQNQANKKMREKALEDHRRDVHEEAVRKQKELDAEMKHQQAVALEEALQHKLKMKLNIKRERAAQQDRHEERLRREEYFIGQKNEKFQTMEDGAKKKAQQLLKKEQELQERMRAEKDKKDAEHLEKKEAHEAKLLKARNDLEKIASDKLTNVMKIIEEKGDRIGTVQAQKLEQHLIEAKESEIKAKEKHSLIKETSDNLLNSKVSKIQSELDRKSTIAQQELMRVEVERARRRAIKEIRQEAFEMCALRKKKADDHKLKKLQSVLDRNDERYSSIKEGERTLKHMRGQLQNVVLKSRLDLLDDIQRLNSHDQLSPENIVDSVYDHTSKILLPRLEQTFGGNTSSPTAEEAPRAKTASSLRKAKSAEGIATSTSPSHSAADMPARPASMSVPKRSVSPPKNLSKRVSASLPLSVFTESVVYGALPILQRQGTAVTIPAEVPRSADLVNVSRSVKKSSSFSKRMHEKNRDSHKFSSSNGAGLSAETSAINFEEDTTAIDTHLQTLGNMSNSLTDEHYSHNNKSIPENKFRPEFSADHPYAGGEGKYDVEKAQGKIRVAPVGHSIKRLAKPSNKGQKTHEEMRRQLESTRKQQNEHLLKLLAIEQAAEEDRMLAYKNTRSSDVEESKRLELVFAEERRRSSEKIISLTKQHEQRIRELLMDIELAE